MPPGQATAEDVVRSAFHSRQRLRMTYVDAQGVMTERTVEVVALGRDRFLAWCGLRDDYRTFLFDRLIQGYLAGPVAGYWPGLPAALSRYQWEEAVTSARLPRDQAPVAPVSRQRPTSPAPPGPSPKARSSGTWVWVVVGLAVAGACWWTTLGPGR